MISSEQCLSKAIEGLCDRPLLQKEKDEAAANLAGFLSVLIEIDQPLNSQSDD